MELLSFAILMNTIVWGGLELASLIRERLSGSRPFLDEYVPPVLLLAVSCAGALHPARSAAFVVLAYFLVFYLLPDRLETRAMIALRRGELDLFRRYSTWLCVVRPLRQNRRQAALAREIGQKGALGSGETWSLGEEILCRRLAVEATWNSELTEIMRQRHWNGLLANVALEALVEAEGLEALAREVELDERLLERTYVQLLILAHAGRVDSMGRFLHNDRVSLARGEPELWLDLTRRKRGEEVTVDLDRLSPAWRRRFSLPPPPDAQRSHRLLRILRQVEYRITDASRFGVRMPFRPLFSGPSLPLATWTLLILNLLVFASEVIAGGSEDGDVLVSLGALVPLRVGGGELWRLLTFWWLHAGPVHLAMNMLTLTNYGPDVERWLGRRALILLHVTGALMGGIATLFRHSLTVRLGVFVGASGGIMAIVGAWIGWMIVGVLLENSPTARRHLKVMGSLLALSMLAELLLPQVSTLLHLIGFLSGLGLTLLFLAFRYRLWVHLPRWIDEAAALPSPARLRP